MSNTALVSQLPNGVVPTITSLRALDVSTCFDGIQVAVNGAIVQNDGGQGTFAFNGANTGLDDTRTVISTPTTGRWVLIDPIFSGLAAAATVSYSGLAESFTLLSGTATALLIYTFPPAITMLPDQVTIKQLGTGQVRLQATGNDVLWDTAGAAAVASITFQSSGGAYTFQPVYYPSITGGIYYRI